MIRKNPVYSAHEILHHAIQAYMADAHPDMSYAHIQQAYRQLKDKYDGLKKLDRAGTTLQAPLFSDNAERIAYLLSRMPATFTVIQHVFHELLSYTTLPPLKSMLDIGTGTGAALWAALLSPLALTQITAIDHDREILQLAKALTHYHADPLWHAVDWQQADITKLLAVTSHDIVTLSYALIEMQHGLPLLNSLWQMTNQILMIIEPGTMRGFNNILAARQFFLAEGAHIVAPCTHAGKCPIKNNNWCHFSARLTRTDWQRQLKQATLGYEDEAYAYLIVSKTPIAQLSARILTPPKKNPGYVTLNLCAPNEIQKLNVSRKQKILYKAAKKKKWGDTWPANE